MARGEEGAADVVLQLGAGAEHGAYDAVVRGNAQAGVELEPGAGAPLVVGDGRAVLHVAAQGALLDVGRLLVSATGPSGRPVRTSRSAMARPPKTCCWRGW
ncbi:hypothetical protein ACFUKV_29270 [Streptomyces paradoxus]|uniref:hypothetical protein n=1 Tax=Streptomyces paradoxus TaxID=66375 RepID=UPI00363B0E27